MQVAEGPAETSSMIPLWHQTSIQIIESKGAYILRSAKDAYLEKGYWIAGPG